jgi:D-galactose 1-dehydrogenase
MSRGVAIVGLGKIARDQHLPAIAGNPDFHLAATASRNAEMPSVPAYSTLADLLAAEPDIPCVSLCTPPQVRYGDARRALEAGRHVMLEKPPGATLSEVHDLIELASRQGLTLFATWHSRYAAGVQAARDWLADKAIESVSVKWHEDVRQWHPGQEWIWQAGGLGVFDPGINALSILTHIFPRQIHLAGAELHFPANRDTPIAADLRFRDAGGARVEAGFDWRAQGEPTWSMQFLTEAGAATLSKGGARFEIAGTPQVDGADAEYPRLYARFASLLDAEQSDVDLAPMVHVADAFTLGRRTSVDAFEW